MEGKEEWRRMRSEEDYTITFSKVILVDFVHTSAEHNAQLPRPLTLILPRLFCSAEMWDCLRSSWYISFSSTLKLRMLLSLRCKHWKHTLVKVDGF